MPEHAVAPPFALLSAVDLRRWSGQTVLKRDEYDVTLPSYGDGEGIYEDMISALCGRGSYSGTSLQSDLTAVGTGAGVWTIQHRNSDRIRLQSTGQAFSLDARQHNATYGYPTSGAASQLVSGVHRMDASAEWLRGVVQARQLRIVPSASDPFLLPSAPFMASDLITMLRQAGSVGDADDLHDPAGSFRSLEAADNAAAEVAGIRWGMDGRGHVFWAAPAALGLAPPTWLVTSFRDRLGFSGREGGISAGGLDWVIADYPCPGVYVPTYPLTRLVRTVEEFSSGMRLSSGGWSGQHRGTWCGWSLSFFVDGPADPRSTWRHFAERFLPYVPVGSRISLYLRWGDPRRSLGPYDAVAGVEPYSLLHTSELEGRRGRIRGRVAGTSDLRRQLDWPGTAERRIPVTFAIDDIEPGA